VGYSVFRRTQQRNHFDGGELGIAPRETLTIQEIEPDLQLAQQQGLQFAIFNNGTDSAKPTSSSINCH
jgi:hypothetical protein